MKASHKVSPVFDEPNLVSAAGLVPVLALAREAGLDGFLQRLSVDSANPAAKALSVIAGMLAGADSIDDLDLLRHGAMKRLFTQVKAPSTCGSFLRAFQPGQVTQLEAVNRDLLAGLQRQVPDILGGAKEGLVFVDVDDTIRQVHGYKKQAAAFGHTRQRGLNIQVACLSTSEAAPVIAGAKLRAGNVPGANGAGQMTARAVACARQIRPDAQPMVRADSGYYRQGLIAQTIKQGAWFSITARMTGPTQRAIAGIDETAWTPIRYPNAVWDETERRFISDAEVAETNFVAFKHLGAGKKIGCRLVVRRVKRLQTHRRQDPLFDHWRYHAFVTNSTLPTIKADQTHRDHAVIEQVIAELKAGPLAHLPSGRYCANAAWTMLAVIGFNLARAAAVTAGIGKARWETLRRTLINIPARLAFRARQLVLHLPNRWPWTQPWLKLHHTVTGTSPPAAAFT